MNSTPAWLYNFLEGNAVMIEVALLLLSSVSILLYYFDIPNSNLFFASFERKGYQITNVGPKIITIGFSVAILGAMFKLLNYPGQEIMLKIGVLSMSIAVLIWGFNNRRNWSNNLVALVIGISRFA